MRSTIIDTVTYLGVLIPSVQGRALQSLSPRNPTAVAGYTAQGCYTEATQGRALTGTAYYNDQMTVEKCAAACGAYTWFGVEYGRECYCGNNLNAGSFSTAISECNFACPGDSMETCGAGNRLNMYQRPATPSPTSTSVVTTPTPGSYSAQGCYTEATQGRALIGKRYDDDGMTIEKCSAECSGFTYFGLEYYRECYCGNDLQAGSTPASSPSACKYPCQGDNSEICGGDYMLNLYMFGNTPAPSAPPVSKSYTFDGCFTEATNSRALTGAVYYDDDMTTDQCAVACQGYTLFGTEYGRECYCGNTLQQGSVQASLSDCNTPCPGARSEFCGGGNRLDLYHFGVASTTSSILSTTIPSSSSSSSSAGSVTSTSITIPTSTTPDSSTSTASLTTSVAPISSSTSNSISISTTSSATTSSIQSTTSSVTATSTLSTSSSTFSPSSSTSIITTTSTSVDSTSSSTMSSSSASSSITSPSPTSNNLVPNSGFEATAASNVYWADRSGRNAIGVSNTATFKVTANSDTAPHSGSQMAAITIKANNVFGSFSQSFPMTPNTQYTISGWYWVPNTANNCALSFYANKPRSQISNTEQSYFIAPRADIRGAAQEQQWIQVSGTFNSGRFDTLEYYVQTSCTTGPVPRVLYFDDMSVTPV